MKQTKLFKFCALLILALSIMVAPVFATTYYVDATNGNDSNDGSSPTNDSPGVGPVATISELFKDGSNTANNVADGDTIQIAAANIPGYTSEDNPLVVDKDVTMIGYELDSNTEVKIVTELEIDNSGDAVSLGESGTASILLDGDLTLTAGDLTIDQANVSMTNGNTLTRTAGTIDETPTIQGAGDLSVIYDGADNVIAGAELPPDLNGGTLTNTISADKTLTINMDVAANNFVQDDAGNTYVSGNLTVNGGNAAISSSGDFDVTGTLDVTANQLVSTTSGTVTLGGLDANGLSANRTVIDNGDGALEVTGTVDLVVDTDGGTDDDVYVAMLTTDDGEMTLNGITGNNTTIADGGSNTDKLVVDLEVNDTGSGSIVIDVATEVDHFTNDGTITLNENLTVTGINTQTHNNNDATIDGNGTLILADGGANHILDNAGTIGALQVDRATEIEDGASVVTVKGAVVVNENLDLDGSGQAGDDVFESTVTVADGATFTLFSAANGDGGNATTVEFQDDVNVAGTFASEAGANATLGEDLVQTGSGTVDADADLDIAGDWTNSSSSASTDVAATSSVDVDGTLTIDGTGTTTVNNAITINNFTQSSGTFLDGTGVNVTIEGDFYRTSGDFDLTTNDGTLIFSGDNATSLTAGPQLVLHDLEVNKTSNAILTVTQSLVIENDLTVASGAGVDFGTKTFTVRNISTWNGAMTSSGAGGLLFDTDDAEIRGSGVYDNITINTTNNVYVKTGHNVEFGGNLYLADGTLMVDDADDATAADLSPSDSATITVNLQNGGQISTQHQGTFNGETNDYNLAYIGALGAGTAVGSEFDASHLIDLTVSTTGDVTELPDADITVAGNLLVDGLMEIDNGNTLTVEGTATISGTVQDDAGGNSTISLDGDNKTHSITGTVDNTDDGNVITLAVAGDTVVINGSTDEDDAAAIYDLELNTNKKLDIANLQEINGTVTTANGSNLTIGLYDGGTNAGEGEIDGVVTIGGDFTMTSDIIANAEVDVDAGTFTFGDNTLQIIGGNDFDGDAGGVTYVSSSGAALNLAAGAGNIGVNGDTLTCLIDIDGATTISSDIYSTGGLDLDGGALANGGNDLHLSGDAIELNNDITGGGTTRVWGSTVTAEQNLTISNLMIDTDGTVTLQSDDPGTNAYTLTVSGLLTLENGVFSYADNDVELTNAGAALAVTDGTLDVTSGKLIVAAAGGVTANTDTSFVIPNLEIANGNGNAVVLTSETDLTVSETLTLTSGDLDADDDAPLHIGDGATVSIVGDVASLTDDPVYDGVVDISYETTGGNITNGTEILDGMNIQNLTVGTGNKLTVDSSLTVTNKFSLSSGTFEEGDGSVTLADSATLSMAGGSFIAGSGPDVTNYYLEYDASGGGVTTSDDDFMTGMIGLNINTGGNTVTLHESRTIGGSVSIEGTGTLDLNTNTLTAEKDVDVSDVGSITVDNGTLTFAGSDTTTLTVDADWSTPAGLDFTVQKDANDGHLNLAGGNLDFTGAEINLIQGVLATGDNKVILDQGAAGGQPTQGFNRNVGVIYGNVEKFIDKSSTTEISNVEFPTGTPDGKYRPAKFYFKTAPPISINLLVNHENVSPGGENGIPFDTGTITVTSYPDFYWKVESDISIAPSYEFDMELQAEDYAYYVTDDIESVRMIRRAEGALDNEWRLQGDDEKYDNQTVMADWPLVKVIDAQGGITSEGSIFTFSQSSQAPRWTMAPAAITLDENTEDSLVYKALDEDINEYPMIEAVGTLPSFATLKTFATSSEATSDSAHLVLAPTYADSGEYDITLRATDGSEYKDTTMTVTVNNVNQPATFVDVPQDTTLDEGEAFTYTYGVEDNDGDSTHFAVVDSVSSDVSITPEGVVTFTAGTGTETGQVDTLVVSVTDSVGTPPVVKDDTLFVTVIKQVAPEFDAVLANQYVRTGDTLTFTYTANDGNGDDLTFALVDTLDSDTIGVDANGDFIFAPTDHMAKDTLEVVVSVTDETGLMVKDTAVVDVRSNVLGDVDLNGMVMAYDASLTLQHVVKKIQLTADSLALADVTGDGNVRAYDASWIFIEATNPDTNLFDSYGSLAKPVMASATPQWSVAETNEEEVVNVPLTLKNTSNVFSFEFTAEVDPSLVKIEDIALSLPEGWQIARNVEDGEVRVAAFGLKPLPASSIGNISLKILDKETASEITGSIVLNENRRADMNSLNIRQIPEEFKISDNYPNPFNPTTTIDYQLPEDSKVVINVYNILGSKVKTLMTENKKAGYYSVQWNGTNEYGNQVASGTYFYHIKAGKHNSVKKMLLIK